jgi:dihydroorotase
MPTLITNGTIIDPDTQQMSVGSILVDNGVVTARYEGLLPADAAVRTAPGTTVIDATHKLISPGFIDPHVHLREPGEEHKETIATGTRAAAAGGYTVVACMPNTRPAIDSVAVVQHIRTAARRAGFAEVLPIAAATIGRAGKELSPMRELVDAGAIGFSDDGVPVSDPAVMRNVFEYVKMLDVPYFGHCEDMILSKGWGMHEGTVSNRLGLPGYPSAAEEVGIARDIALAELTNSRLHVCHVSTAGGVALIRAAKARGVNVTGEASPHHMTLSDRWVLGWLDEQAEASNEPGMSLNPTTRPPYDTNTRVSPPLRSDADCDAVLQGLLDGTLDFVATDHAPHGRVDKEVEYRLAMAGITGIETALASMLMLVNQGRISLMDLIVRMTDAPAAFLGRGSTALRIGARADITVIDPQLVWTVEASKLFSLGKNTPLLGQKMRGKAVLTMYKGNITHQEG